MLLRVTQQHLHLAHMQMHQPVMPQPSVLTPKQAGTRVRQWVIRPGLQDKVHLPLGRTAQLLVITAPLLALIVRRPVSYLLHPDISLTRKGPELQLLVPTAAQPAPTAPHLVPGRQHQQPTVLH